MKRGAVHLDRIWIQPGFSARKYVSTQCILRQLCLQLNKTQPELKNGGCNWKENRNIEIFLIIKLAVETISSPQAQQQYWMSNWSTMDLFFLTLFSHTNRKQQALNGSKSAFSCNLYKGSNWALNEPMNIYLSDAQYKLFLNQYLHVLSCFHDQSNILLHYERLFLVFLRWA